MLCHTLPRQSHRTLVICRFGRAVRQGGAGDAAQSNRRSEELLANTGIDSFPITNTAAPDDYKHIAVTLCLHSALNITAAHGSDRGIAASASTKHSPSQSRAATTKPSPTHSLTRHKQCGGAMDAADKARHTSRDAKRLRRRESNKKADVALEQGQHAMADDSAER